MAGRERRRDECQTLFGVGLARNRRMRPSRPSEPRPSGVHPSGAEWEKDAETTALGFVEREVTDGKKRDAGCLGESDSVKYSEVYY